MMPYLSCKKIENDVYNFPTWQYCKYKDIFDSRIIINSTAKFYISISYQKDLLSIDTRIFTPSFLTPFALYWNIQPARKAFIYGLFRNLVRYSNSTTTNQFCLEIICYRICLSFNSLICPYYPACIS